METLKSFIDFFIHLDDHISQIITQYGTGTYIILFLIIFVETGLVIMPLLPGDSLLFVLGAFVAKGSLSMPILWISLTIAAIIGDAVNYAIGAWLAPKVFNNEKIPFLKQEHLDKTKAFYEKHGNKTIILARFIPIIRTFAPFLAGVAKMPYPKFAFYNIIGAILWVTIGLWAGYFFGNLPWVEKNFSLVIFAIIAISLIPAVWEYINHKRGK